LNCDGWLTIRQGKATRVNDIWREGGLNVLGALVRYSKQLPAGFVPNLLEVRLALAPAYSCSAVERSPAAVVDYLANYVGLDDEPAALAAFDWTLHYNLTVASGNPVYTLILNGFAGFYEDMARAYFAQASARASSRVWYASLLDAARQRAPDAAEEVTREAMQESINLWQRSGGMEL
jgi:GntR family negative regulator for fad regulon and positive regulator of fabA